MTTETKPDKYWGTLFEQASKEISLFQQAVLNWPNPPEAASQGMLIGIFVMRERGMSAMNRINCPDLPEAYHPDRSRLTHVWIEAEDELFRHLETDKDYIDEEGFVNQITRKAGDLFNFIAMDSKTDISTIKSGISQNIELCPDPGILIEFALNELEKDQSAHIKEHIGTCFLCQDLVFDTVMAENETIQKQGEDLVISDRILSAISSDTASEFYKRLLNLVINVNSHIKNRARDQSFRQKGFVFVTASSDEQSLKGADDIPFELKITPHDGLLQIPCTGDAGEGKTFIGDILERSCFYTHIFAWDMAKNRIDLGINRHKRNATAISVVGYTDLLVVAGLDKADVVGAARYIPFWFEKDDFKIEREPNATVVLLWYRIVKED